MTEEVTKSPIFRTDEHWKKTYNEQRKDRLNDSVCEYLEDENPEVFWRELNECLDEWISYHRGQSDRNLHLLKK